MDASCCSILASRRVISSLIVSMSRRCVAISKACTSRNRPVSATASCWRVAFSRRSPRAASAAGSLPRRPGRPGTAARWCRTGRRSPRRSSAGRPRGSSRPGSGAGTWSWPSRDRVRVSDRRSRIPSGGTSERRSIPRSFSLHSHTAIFPVGFAPAGKVLSLPGVDQPHLQASGLRQVIPDPPVIRGALEHQPLDALAPQVIHQRDHGRVGGIHLPHRLPLAVRPGLPAPGCTPSPTPWRHRPRPRTSPPRRAPRPPPRLTAARAGHSRRPSRGAVLLRALPSSHRRLASLDREPAGSCPGSGAGKTESDRRARSDSTQPA